MRYARRIDLAKFLKGWMLMPPSETAHYFTRTNGGMKANCGLRFKPAMRDKVGYVAFEQGNFRRCKKCEAHPHPHA